MSTSILASVASYTVRVMALDTEELLWLPSPRTLNLTVVSPTAVREGFAV